MARNAGRHMRKELRRRSRWTLALLMLLLLCGIVAAVLLVALPRWEARQGASQTGADVQEPQGNEASVTEDDAPGPAGEPSVKPTSRFAELLDAGEVHSIRLIGDSITAGWGTDGFFNPSEGNVIYDNGAGKVHYEPTADSRCWANAFREYAAQRGVESFVNAGIGGAFMVGDFSDSPEAWIREGADVIFVALGTNDAGYYGPQDFAEAAERSLAAAAEHGKLVVVVSPVSDLRPEHLLVEPAATLADVLRPLCEEQGYEFVDASGAVAPSQFNDDGLHPSSEGSLAIWDCIRTTLGLA